MKARNFPLLIFMAALLAAGNAVAQTSAQAPVQAPPSTPPAVAAAAPAAAAPAAVQQLQQQMQAQTPGGGLPAASTAQTVQAPVQQATVPKVQPSAGPAAVPGASTAAADIRPSAATDSLLSHQNAELTSRTDPDDVIDVQKQISDPYLESSLPNLAKAYWAIGAFDWSDDQAIDDYLMITECPLYKQYFNNEFEWENVRHAAKVFLQKNLSKLPTRFEAVIPIKLGRYDPDTSQFDILANDQKHAIFRILIDIAGQKPACGVRGDIPGYPRNVVALLDRPFTITSVPVDPRIAEFYLNDIRLNYQHRNPRQSQTDYERIAYLRLKLRFLQFKEIEKNPNGPSAASVFTKIEGWDVYADPEETKPLMIYTIPVQDKPTTFMAGQNMNIISRNSSDPSKEYIPREARQLPPDTP